MIRVSRRGFRVIAALQAAATAVFLFVHRLAGRAAPGSSGDGMGDFETWSYWNGWLGILFVLVVALWALGVLAARFSPPAEARGIRPEMLARCYAAGVPLVVGALMLAGA